MMIARIRDCSGGRLRRAGGTLVVALVGLAAAGCGQPAREITLPPFDVETLPWRHGRAEGKLIITPHYKIHTTLKDDKLIELLPKFVETAHLGYVNILPVEGAAEAKSNLYIFQTRNQWARFVRQFSPGRADTYLRIRAGGFAEPDGTVLYYLKRYHTFAVVAHECLHMYIYRHFPRRAVPPWLNEGLACYCEAHRFQGTKPVFTPGENRFRMNAVRRALKSGSLFDLREMLATNAGQVVLLSPDKIGAYYAQAWSMVAFLIHGGQYAEPFARLRAELGTAKMRQTVEGYLAANPTGQSRPTSYGEALFRSYITDDLDRFSADYGLWLKKISQPQKGRWRLLGSDRPLPDPRLAWRGPYERFATVAGHDGPFLPIRAAVQ